MYRAVSECVVAAGTYRVCRLKGKKKMHCCEVIVGLLAVYPQYGELVCHMK